MPFFEHLAELRVRLAYIVIFLFVGSLALYFVWEPIYHTIMIPVTPVLASMHVTRPIATGVFEIFIFRFKVAFFAAVILGSPFIVYHILAFFLPALKPKERKWFVPTLAGIVFFFLLGAGFCWKFILGPGFAWLLSQGGDVVQVLPMADKLLSSVLLFMLAFGVGFETPVVVFLLVSTGIVPYAKLRKNWRVAYLTISIVSATVTPDWSWISMGSLAIAMIILYEGAMAASYLLMRKRIKAQALEEATEAA